MRANSPTFTVRILAAISLTLALMCLALAWQTRRAEDRAACWRSMAEDGIAPEGDCRHARAGFQRS
jgi:hypothetical protein